MAKSDKSKSQDANPDHDYARLYPAGEAPEGADTEPRGRLEQENVRAQSSEQARDEAEKQPLSIGLPSIAKVEADLRGEPSVPQTVPDAPELSNLAEKPDYSGDDESLYQKASSDVLRHDPNEADLGRPQGETEEGESPTGGESETR
jgi:hypothetical protein